MGMIIRDVGLLARIVLQMVKLDLFVLERARGSFRMLDNQLPRSLSHRFGSIATIAQ